MPTDNIVTVHGPEVAQPLPCDKPHKDGNLKNEDLLVKLFYGEPLTHDEIADIFGVSRVAVTNKVNKLGLQRVAKSPEEYEADLSNELMLKIQLIMNQISADKINKASLSQLGTLLGILYDKRTLHDRKGTPEISYIGVIHKFDQSNLDQIRAIMQQETAKRIEEQRLNRAKELAIDAEYSVLPETESH